MAGGKESSGARVKTGWHIGEWGNPYEGGGQPGRGTVTYTVSPNRQRPMAGVISKGPWNVFRRTKNQILYVLPPFVGGYFLMEWAIERNEYLNSKAGIKEFGGQEE
ncbi:cytochrome b-c1 complex subunit 8 [Clohesyomyces aquaticus]|uniref:Cytochrome b-c1 complex subunit 8 n=1 Tax=Clohesyomyces aquaticus TaxID=1231657 RepID=A0A1Y1Z7C4_9PLEO|nr:cytochrome b-c1 complex subunit 8 [Clohesyomyces aquaticus]